MRASLCARHAAHTHTHTLKHTSQSRIIVANDLLRLAPEPKAREQFVWRSAGLALASSRPVACQFSGRHFGAPVRPQWRRRVEKAVAFCNLAPGNMSYGRA